MAGTPSDAGKTSGGGSLGHDQPDDVASQTPIRNNPRSREDREDEVGQSRDDSDPVMPANDSTLNTKI